MKKTGIFLLLMCLTAFLLSCEETKRNLANNQQNSQVENSSGGNSKADDTKLDLDGSASNNVVQPRIEFDVKPLLARQKSINENFPNSSNLLAFDLYKKLAAEKNLTFSPLSISSALAMAYAGSKEDTQSSFKKVLHFGDNTPQFHKSYGEFTLLLANKDRSANDTTVEIANALWLQKGFNVLDEFKNLLNTAYKAQPIELDFKGQANRSTEIINQTISTQTHGEINRLLKASLSPDTHMVLSNALYFKSLWESPFKASLTSNENFTLADGSSMKTNFMKQEKNFLYGEDGEKQFLLMPYKDNEFASLFVLPGEGKFDAVQNAFDEKSFKTMLQNLADKDVSFWLPKFSQRMSPNIKNILVELGLTLAFDRLLANFSAISGEKNFFIEDIAHEAVVKMYEEGTKAAAATAITFAPTSIAEPEPDKFINFHADRPFFFFIFHQPSQTILFMGRVNEPKDDV